MADEIQVQSVAHVVFEGFTTLDMYGPVQAFASCRVPDGDGGWHRGGGSARALRARMGSASPSSQAIR